MSKSLKHFRLRGRHHAVPVIEPAKIERIAAFISIPRNASTSVRKILGLGPNRDDEHTNSLVIHENHQRGVVLEARYPLDDLFTFCFVRNPYWRCVSWYEYHRGIEPYASLSFAVWIEAGLPSHWRQQNETDYEKLRLTPLLQQTFITGCKIDFIGRIENFENDLRYVIDKLNTMCRATGLKQSFGFRNLRSNRSKRSQGLNHYYNSEMKERVFTLLKDDFIQLGYER